VFRANLQKYDEKKLVSWQAYQPKKSETLESIAKKFGMTVAQLREVNGIASRSRGVPSTLVVSLNGAAGEAKRLPIMYAPPIPVAGPRSFTHTVKLGETLPSIAERYRVSVDDLRRWNKIGRVTAGQKLTIESQARTGSRKGRTVEKTKGKPRNPKPARAVKRS